VADDILAHISMHTQDDNFEQITGTNTTGTLLGRSQ
jgi:hypothetical protein